MFLSRYKKNNVYPGKPQFYYVKVGFKGIKLYFRDGADGEGPGKTVDAQVDLALCCPHMPRDTFSHGAAHIITKTYLYNFDPLKPHFYTVKLGFTRVYIIFLISAQKHRMWVLLEPPRCGGSNKYPQSMF